MFCITNSIEKSNWYQIEQHSRIHPLDNCSVATATDVHLASLGKAQFDSGHGTGT
ncbi:hypothetical protein SynRS9915_02831 [Synechococcus sp. RS9915]|nr:hypothetical protein SynRS9915_02831 [Synechococcus sp. RS9915]